MEQRAEFCDVYANKQQDNDKTSDKETSSGSRVIFTRLIKK